MISTMGLGHTYYTAMNIVVEYSALLADCLFAVTFELIDYCIMTIASCMILEHSVPCAFCECVLRLCSLLLLINKIYPDNSAYFRAKSTANRLWAQCIQV